MQETSSSSTIARRVRVRWPSEEAARSRSSSRLKGAGARAASLVLTDNAGDFSAFNSCTPAVNAGDNWMVVVFFKPTVTGVRSGTITITDNANNVTGATQTIQLSGTGN
jgi:hypothetical protein